LNEQGAITYYAFQISTKGDAAQMIVCKSYFPINTIIEFFVTFTRSTEEILSLLHLTPLSSSTNPNFVSCSLAILYYRRPLKRASITNNPYGYGLYCWQKEGSPLILNDDQARMKTKCLNV